MSDYDEDSQAYSEDPESLGDVVPDDSLLIRYPSVDPTKVLNNPENFFEATKDNFFDKPVPEELKPGFLQLLEQYNQLIQLNFTIYSDSVKRSLTEGDLKSRELYRVLNNMYLAVPELNSEGISSSFLSNDTIALFVTKHTLHTQITESLKGLSATFESIQDAQDHEEEVSDIGSEESDDLGPVIAEAKRNNFVTLPVVGGANIAAVAAKVATEAIEVLSSSDEAEVQGKEHTNKRKRKNKKRNNAKQQNE
jgi:hypothetical protein